jgi:hypothetical protein
MIEIVKWSEIFESADTRKRQRLGWFLNPSGCDSKGFRKLMRDGKDGLEALGFFQALCQSMATMGIKTRQSGIFRNSDETMMDFDDIMELSRLDGREPADYRQITGRLVACGWIRLHNSLESEQSATCLPPVCHSSPGFVKGEGEGQGQEEGEGEEREIPPTTPPSSLSDKFTTQTASDLESVIQRIRRLRPGWEKTALTYDEMQSVSKNASCLLSISADDWNMIGKYLHAKLPQGDASWQPRFRKQLIEHAPDVLQHASNWAFKNGKNPKPAADNSGIWK